jgi:hypothetical protein
MATVLKDNVVLHFNGFLDGLLSVRRLLNNVPLWPRP